MDPIAGSEIKHKRRKDFDPIEVQYIMKKLVEKKIPAGYEIELIIIGDQAYSVVERVQQFFGEKQVTKELLKVDAIPEGIFFAEDYSPRILIEGNKILAVELLKRSNQDDDNDDRFLPFPFIFKPPSPPDDIAPQGNTQLILIKSESESESELLCKFCGTKLQEGQTICHVCRNKVD